MYRTILKLLSPYIQKWIAARVVTYLNARREKQALDAAAPDEASSNVPEVSPPSSTKQGNALLFALFGVVFGGLLGFILSQLRQRN